MVSNDLTNGLSNAKLFTGGTSLFTLVDNVSTSAGEVNKGKNYSVGLPVENEFQFRYN